MRNPHYPALSFTQIPAYDVVIARSTLEYNFTGFYHVIFHHAHLEFYRPRAGFVCHVNHLGAQSFTGNRFWFASISL